MDHQSVSSINIKRSDGRVHSAHVVDINYNLKNATVEWFENGETKGKKIDMPSIESLNPDMIILRPSEPKQNTAQTEMNQLRKNPTLATMTNKTTNDTKYAARVHSRQPEHFQTNGHSHTVDTSLVKDTSSRIPNINPQNSKCSSAVKEIEKLKKNREERRQRQAEEKAEKEAFLQMAPGNPHWELLNMIL